MRCIVVDQTGSNCGDQPPAVDLVEGDPDAGGGVGRRVLADGDGLVRQTAGRRRGLRSQMSTPPPGRWPRQRSASASLPGSPRHGSAICRSPGTFRSVGPSRPQGPSPRCPAGTTAARSCRRWRPARIRRGHLQRRGPRRPATSESPRLTPAAAPARAIPRRRSPSTSGCDACVAAVIVSDPRPGPRHVVRPSGHGPVCGWLPPVGSVSPGRRPPHGTNSTLETLA